MERSTWSVFKNNVDLAFIWILKVFNQPYDVLVPDFFEVVDFVGNHVFLSISPQILFLKDFDCNYSFRGILSRFRIESLLDFSKGTFSFFFLVVRQNERDNVKVPWPITKPI